MKKLNINKIEQQLTTLGLNQSELAKELNVSRETVSAWFKEKYFPLPSKLLSLGKLLKLKYGELVISGENFEPVVSFRKVGQKKTKPLDIQRGLEMGYSLEKLVPYLPFETITRTPILKNPINDYNYVQQVANIVRNKIDANNIKIELSSIVGYFNELKIIMIPLLLGEKNNHENAMHVYLPKNSTTWIYINLDTQIFDFKFWLIHELGHVIAPKLVGDSGEQFADNFAGAFLFPKEISQKTYADLRLLGSTKSKILRVLDLAKEYAISPYSIIKEINKYATNNDLANIELGPEFPKYCHRFLNKYGLYSKLKLDENTNIQQFLQFVESEFNTEFFNMLKKFSEENGLSYSFLKSLLNLPAGDTMEFLQYLTNGPN